MKNDLAAYKRKNMIDRFNSAKHDLSPLQFELYELKVSLKTRPQKVR
ncbi:MAG: hypothetical protein ACI9XU_001784 [Arenicella sp.]|jgi:hypothetical protein